MGLPSIAGPFTGQGFPADIIGISSGSTLALATIEHMNSEKRKPAAMKENRYFIFNF
jgi:hypothetical protein